MASGSYITSIPITRNHFVSFPSIASATNWASFVMAISASNQALLRLVVIRRLFPGAAGEITMRAQRRVHFSLVAYRRQFYNTALHVRPHAGDVHRILTARARYFIHSGQPFGMDRTCKPASANPT